MNNNLMKFKIESDPNNSSTNSTTSSNSISPLPTNVNLTSSKSSSSSYETLKQSYDKQSKDLNEMSSKFKLLEQIHLETIKEYDKQHSKFYAQLDDLNSKLNRNERELDDTHKTFNLLKQTNTENVQKIQLLNEQILKYKDTVQQQEKEIEKLKLNAPCMTISSRPTQQISGQTLQDFGDDLAKVLISKEEVINHLEKQLKEKEKQIQSLSKQLNDEMTQSSKYQDAFNMELNRNTQLNDQLKSLNENLSEQYSDELENYKEQILKSKSILGQYELNINQLSNEKNKFELELKSLQEYSRNEIEILQEEVKTLEYKLVFTQRQAQEYQSLLEDMDATNSNSFNYLSQLFVSMGGSLSSLGIQDLNAANGSNSNTNSLQSCLKRNQSYVNLLMQNILEIKNSNFDELKQTLGQLQGELDEVREENVELNDHIYSIDVYMREKEAESEKLQKEKEDLEAEINSLKFKSSNLFLSCKKSTSNDRFYERDDFYRIFVKILCENLSDQTQNFNEFFLILINLVQFLLSYESSEDLTANETALIDFIRHKLCNFDDSAREFTLDKMRKYFTNKFSTSSSSSSTASINKSNLINLRLSLKKLIKYLNSTELNQFNTQIISYMAEQLIHKSALNGHLKFACELLRKKFESPTVIPSIKNCNNINNSSPSGVSNNNAVTNLTSSVQPNANLSNGLNINEQDEKIFKLASELLLSDEDSLRKLSTQVLNEAQHLNQLNCVLNTLRKYRWKHLSSNNNLEMIKKAYESLKQQQQNNSSDLTNNSESDFEDLEQINSESNDQEKNDQNNELNYILEGKFSFFAN
jgi:hypothetical protein